MRTECLCISVLRVASDPGWLAVKVLLSPTSPPLRPAPQPRPRWLCGILYEAICFISDLVSFVVLFFFFSPFRIAITSLRKERANFSAFRTFVRLCCLDLSVSSSSWCLRRDAVCNCGTPWTLLLLFFPWKIHSQKVSFRTST